MDRQEMTLLIEKNAEECRQLHRRIHDTFKHRDEDSEKRDEWGRACSEFHAHYNTLAFPGGYEGAFERIVKGDPYAMEAALCFVEVRPYFFRSGYMFKALLPKLKKAPLNPDQAKRLQTVLAALAEWKKTRGK
ncbi:MAG: hypothetical protein L6R28_00905 [Planctomycetes bacterium]|nr:hypothetical protein [Planctomycetota bacterium]